LYVCTGIANINTEVQGGLKTETWTFLVGPSFQATQFRRAVATASIANSTFQLNQPPTGPVAFEQTIVSVEADWDDESRQTEVRVEVSVFTDIAYAYLRVRSLAFSVSILAAV
jgi:hypothetical protein